MKTSILFFICGTTLILNQSNILASVTDSSSYGFTVREELIIKTSPDSLYNEFTDIGKWWDSEHTYSGKAVNLSFQPVAGGCFCEKLDNGGSVQHMTVIFVKPGKTIRMEGGLGPLQSMAVSGTMTVVFVKIPEGTKLTVTYTVGGYSPGGLIKIAPMVDMVLGQQVMRLRDLAEHKEK